MNAEINKIKTLITETANGNNWTGINAEQALKDISAETATKRINSNHLNIAELTAHLACWNNVISKRLEGVNYTPVIEEDFPVINELSGEQWQILKQDFFNSFEILIRALSQKEDVSLDQPIFEEGTSVYRNVHGQVSHLHYHLGQIVLLKKIII
ncbi:MAG: DinB family protein [Chitinophagales bacterium]|nr:DinB family protein [Chitinophagales bacterium]